MTTYLWRRLALLGPMVVLISLVVFCAIRMIPVDPVSLVLGPFAGPGQRELARQKLGIDKPLYIQYAIFLKNAAHGDFGRSIRSGKQVTLLIRNTLPNTLLLGLTAFTIASMIAIPMGLLAAVKRNKVVDQCAMGFAMLSMAIPHFWLGLILILVFALNLHWLPATGIGTWKHLILPSVTLGMEGAALIARMTRSAVLEVLRQDYVRTARAKGLRERRVMFEHTLRNALVPIVSLLGLNFGRLVGGAVIVETVFGWPGMGRLLVDSILNRDYPVVQAVIIVLGISVMLANLLTDTLYAFLDPRIKYAN